MGYLVQMFKYHYSVGQESHIFGRFNKLGLSCAKLSTASVSYPLAKQLELAISVC